MPSREEITFAPTVETVGAWHRVTMDSGLNLLGKPLSYSLLLLSTTTADGRPVVQAGTQVDYDAWVVMCTWLTARGVRCPQLSRDTVNILPLEALWELLKASRETLPGVEFETEKELCNA